VATLASALLTGILFAGIAWLYEVENIARFVAVPAGVAGAIMLVVGLTGDIDRVVPTGMIVYNITRTILNVLRAIEPLIMVVAFAVWVGIGPFAGVMALALHTIASLGKLYSEQVENILTGPIEAVTATGANRLQTIVYAVIPQIVPPYLAFTIYRWDINVRMSTIIGFGGGGGIGFLVQQNLNLLKYRDAAVQMIAIAIVVATLDYASARVREKII
jgi:phosphonate ABC transporter permease subunit PhnE